MAEALEIANMTILQMVEEQQETPAALRRRYKRAGRYGARSWRGARHTA
jgi:hypothetical protein